MVVRRNPARAGIAARFRGQKVTQSVIRSRLPSHTGPRWTGTRRSHELSLDHGCRAGAAVVPVADLVPHEGTDEHDDESYAFDEDHGRRVLGAWVVRKGRFCMVTSVPVGYCVFSWQLSEERGKTLRK